MKASYLGAMGYSQRRDFPVIWPVPPVYHDPATSVQSYQEGIAECELAEQMGFEWISFSEHHYSGRIATGTPSIMAAAVAERSGAARVLASRHSAHRSGLTNPRAASPSNRPPARRWCPPGSA